MYKAAKNLAQRRHDEIKDVDAMDEEVAARTEEATGPALLELRQEALRIARRLLPRLGQRNVERVMGFVLDAVEADVPDVGPAEIAEALGLSNDVVRQSLHRGFQRLERIAREEGLQRELTDVLDEGAALHDDDEEGT